MERKEIPLPSWSTGLLGAAWSEMALLLRTDQLPGMRPCALCTVLCPCPGLQRLADTLCGSVGPG